MPEGYKLPDGRSAKAFFTPGTLNPTPMPMHAVLSLRWPNKPCASPSGWATAFSADQRLAARALALLGAGSKLPSWLRNLDALIVDEVQDLTLLQTLVLGELARTRLQRRP